MALHDRPRPRTPRARGGIALLVVVVLAGLAPRPAAADFEAPPVANLAVTLSAPASVSSGRNLTYRAVVRNAGPEHAPGTIVSVAVPSGSTLERLGAQVGTKAVPVEQCNSTALATTGVVTCAVGTLGRPGGTQPNVATVTLTVRATMLTGRLVGRATASGASSDLNRTDNIASTATDVLPRTADTSLSMTAASLDPDDAGQNRVTYGSQLRYSLTASNAGPYSAPDVVVATSLPDGTTFVSAATTRGTCTSPAAGTRGQVTCAVGNLSVSPAAASAARVDIVVTVKGAGVLRNVATVASATVDPVRANNRAVAEVPIAGSVIVGQTSTADLAVATAAVTGTAGRDGVTYAEVGRQFGYVTTVTNGGAATSGSQDASGAIVIDTLPALATFVGASLILPDGTGFGDDGDPKTADRPLSSVCTVPQPTRNPDGTSTVKPGGTVSCTLGLLPRFTTALLTVDVTVPNDSSWSPGESRSMVNTASIVHPFTIIDPAPRNDAATNTMQVQLAVADVVLVEHSFADLHITNVVVPGDTKEQQVQKIDVRNSPGAGTATNVNISVTFAPGIFRFPIPTGPGTYVPTLPLVTTPPQPSGSPPTSCTVADPTDGTGITTPLAFKCVIPRLRAGESITIKLANRVDNSILDAHFLTVPLELPPINPNPLADATALRTSASSVAKVSADNYNPIFVGQHTDQAASLFTPPATVIVFSNADQCKTPDRGRMGVLLQIDCDAPPVLATVAATLVLTAVLTILTAGTLAAFSGAIAQAINIPTQISFRLGVQTVILQAASRLPFLLGSAAVGAGTGFTGGGSFFIGSTFANQLAG